MARIDSETLREWRRSRGWDVPEMARRLRRSANEPIAAHDGLVRMIRGWERGDHEISERYELLYRAAVAAADGQPAASWADGQARDPEHGPCEMPCRTSDGRIVFVTVPRRTILQGAAGLAAFSFTPSSGVRPAERFLLARRALRDNDNLFGPRDVIPLAVRQLEAMQHAADSLRGADRHELLLPQIQFADLLGWLYQDSCEYGAARHWLDRALEWAHLLRDQSCVTFILSRKSQLACDMSDPGEAVALAEAAMRLAGQDTVLGAVAATYGAHAYALDGDEAASSHLYDWARSAVSADDSTPWAAFFGEPYIEVYRAQSLGFNLSSGAFGFLFARLAAFRRDWVAGCWAAS